MITSDIHGSICLPLLETTQTKRHYSSEVIAVNPIANAIRVRTTKASLQPFNQHAGPVTVNT